MNNKALSLDKNFYKLHPEVITLNFLACIQAIARFGGPEERLNWDILIILHAQKGPVSFQVIYQTFHRGNPGRSNARYYRAFDQLSALNYIRMEYGGKGWRLWSITPEGRKAVKRLNEAAAQYLPD